MTASADTGQTWDAERYAHNGRFVAELASPVLRLLAPKHGEQILDLGCGDGALTAQLAATGAAVVGVDASPAMVAAARARGLTVEQHLAQDMPFRERFDAVFSNAALHWIPLAEQPAALAAIFRALRSGGRLVAELGALGNIAAIRTALAATLRPLELDSEALAASCFPSPDQYRAMLTEAGFLVSEIAVHPRPTPLPGGPDGMALWLETFRNGVLDHLPPPVRAQALAGTVSLLRPILFDPARQSWTADYVRLRLHATRPA